MTVTYTSTVATAKPFGCFLKLLFRWRGSIYKLVWMDLLLFLTVYYVINYMYFYGLNDARKRTFESLVLYCSNYGTLIPLSFVLGFYVNLVMQRWWDQYLYLPWPDSVAVYVSAHIQGSDESSRVMRRTIMRYVCVCITMCLTLISPAVKKRFPTLQHLVDAGLLQSSEKNVIMAIDDVYPPAPKHWMPIVWATSIVTRARKEGRIRDDYAVKTIIDALNSIRGSCGSLLYYDFISVPLVYTQVVTLAVYSFFLCSLLAHQFTVGKVGTYEELDFYFPIFISLQFFFYMGWLKVAETLINPFGDDDDDFEVNWMIDRHLQVSYMIVDEMHHEHPELVKDQYWDEIFPNELPYDKDVPREKPPEHSTAKYDKENTPNTRFHGSIINASLLSQRSEQFNQTFEQFGVISDELTSERVHNITSYVTQTSSSQLFMEEAYNTMSDNLHEDQFDGEDEFDRFVESRSKSSADFQYSTPEDDLFDKLTLERQQQRTQGLRNYLRKYFSSNYAINVKKPESSAEPANVEAPSSSTFRLAPPSEHVEKTVMTEPESSSTTSAI